MDFPNVTLKHISSKENVIADLFSRAVKCPIEDGTSDYFLKVPLCAVSTRASAKRIGNSNNDDGSLSVDEGSVNLGTSKDSTKLGNSNVSDSISDTSAHTTMLNNLKVLV